MTGRVRPFLCLWLCAGLLVILGAGDLSGQMILPGRRQAEEPADIFLPAPRGLRQQLSRAAKALEEEQLSEAVDLLGQLLAEPGAGGDGAGGASEQDYFLADSETGGTQTSLKSEAQRLLGSMPDKGRELYELKFGADARQLLDRALDARDLPALVEVTRRYFHTSAGYEATMLIGRYYLDQGRPLAAALRFERLVASPRAARQYEPELSVLLATCWLLAGMPDRARETLAQLQASHPQATLRIGDTQVSLFQDEAGALGRLEQLVGPLEVPLAAEAAEWVLHRGNPARNAESRAGLPLAMVRWRVRVFNHPSDENLLLQQSGKFRDEGVPAIPTLEPLAVDNVILLRTPQQLLAIDMKTGKHIWAFPWSEDANTTVLQSDQFRPDSRIPDPYAAELTQRVWDDAPYGQMSSDGRRVFLLWRVASDLPSLTTRVLPFGRQRPDGSGETNKLVALDIATEGKLQWIVGDEDGTDEPQLAGAYFLGPPLPLLGQLYVLAEINSEIRLVVLDAATGRLSWAQQLAHVDQREIMSDPTRRAAGASPSFSDGVLVCPTSAGAVVAVDIASRSLLWGYRYAHAPGTHRVTMNIYQTRPLGERWADATVTIVDGRVLVTPVESDQIHCLDLLTGRPLWDPQPRSGLLFTACATGEQAVLVGADRVQAISLASGATIWTQALPEGMPSGRGLRTGSAYFLPTTTGHLLKIDITTGQIAADMRTDEPLGNLVAYRDQIISQSVQWLSAYYQADPLRAVVADRLKDDPDDVWALTHRADLLLADGAQHEALEVLRRAYRIAPQDAVRASLVRTLMSALAADFAHYRPYAAELEALIDQPAQRVEFYRVMTTGLRGVGALDESVDYLLKLTALATATPAVGSEVYRDGLVQLDANWRVRLDRWIAVNLGEVLSMADGPLRQRIDAAVAARYEAVSQQVSVPDLRRFLHCFSPHPLAMPVQFQLARLLLERNECLAAELALVPLQESSDPATAAQATAWLARLLHASGHLPEAVGCYERLARQWPDVAVQDSQTGQAVADAALADPQLRRAAGAGTAWPYGKVDVSIQSRNTFQSYQYNFAVPLIDVSGPFPEDASLVYNRQLNAVLIRDGLGHTRTQVSIADVNNVTLPNINAPAGTAAAEGHLVIACVGSDVLAIDTFKSLSGSEVDSPIQWRDDLTGSVLGSIGLPQVSAHAITRPWGPTRYVLAQNLRPVGSIGPITSAGFFYQKSQELLCVEPLTGDVIWTRSGIEPGSDLFGDQEYLFVASPNLEDALVLRASDGKELGRRFVGSRQSRWITVGRSVLYVGLAGDRIAVRWFDAWTGTDLWQHRFTAGAQCALLGRDALAVYELSGAFTVINLADGTLRFTTQLAREPQLARLYVIPSRDTCIVLASRQAADEDSMTRYRPATPLGSDLCPEINGCIYALDMQTGRPQWPAAAQVARVCCPLDQPAESPALVFLQNSQSTGAEDAPRPAVKGSALCLDRRDGRQLLYEEDLAMIRTYAITAQPADHTLTINSNTKQLTLRFTDEPFEKQPPVQFLAPPARPTAIEQVGKVARGILDAIAKPKAPEGEAPQRAGPASPDGPAAPPKE